MDKELIDLSFNAMNNTSPTNIPPFTFSPITMTLTIKRGNEVIVEIHGHASGSLNWNSRDPLIDNNYTYHNFLVVPDARLRVPR